ncbi:hypothetical protein EDB92DRAFT_1950204 [Lactarius akahatsu]|uniref:Uncharacterized protein n=1 Tax=Lactarius akahatsu TaxID=416441 RepID=A0AAD4LBA2_9AGAM|nr:hypothetical protein EDB92DRAFT_1950204 [Lactarius akahatsu]
MQLNWITDIPSAKGRRQNRRVGPLNEFTDFGDGMSVALVVGWELCTRRTCFLRVLGRTSSLMHIISERISSADLTPPILRDSYCLCRFSDGMHVRRPRCNTFVFPNFEMRGAPLVDERSGQLQSSPESSNQTLDTCPLDRHSSLLAPFLSWMLNAYKWHSASRLREFARRLSLLQSSPSSSIVRSVFARRLVSWLRPALASSAIGRK